MNNKLIIILAFLITIFLMAVGYSSLATDISVNGVAEITGSWLVRIADIKAISISDGCDAGTPTFTDNLINFSAKLQKPGDEIVYEVTIQNDGSLDATLQSVVFLEEPEGPEAINYTTTSLDKELKAGEKTTFNIKVTYVKNTTEIPQKKTKTLTGIIEYVQK